MAPSGDFVECVSAPLFPPEVAHYSLQVFAGDADWCSRFAIELPDALAGAAPKRRRDFLAGRYCARQALTRLAPEFAMFEVRVGAGREPIWPEGVVGSITHTDGFASAAVAWQRDVLALGLDSERVRSLAGAGEIESQVFEVSEFAALLANGLSRQHTVFIGFSAKEAVFKCLYPRARALWEFDEVELTSLEPKHNAFGAKGRSARASKVWPVEGVRGAYALDSAYVHTGAFVLVDDLRLRRLRDESRPRFE